MEQQDILKNGREKMEQAIDALQKKFRTLQTGRANAGILESVRVDYYGTPTPVNQVGNITTPESRLIMITPWEKGMLGEIEKAINTANLGLNPQNDGSVIRIALPELSGERRKELVKVAKGMAEEIRVSIRNIRRDANDSLKKVKKDENLSEDELKEQMDLVQDMTDEFIRKVDDLTTEKEKEITTV